MCNKYLQTLHIKRVKEKFMYLGKDTECEKKFLSSVIEKLIVYVVPQRPWVESLQRKTRQLEQITNAIKIGLQIGES